MQSSTDGEDGVTLCFRNRAPIHAEAGTLRRKDNLPWRTSHSLHVKAKFLERPRCNALNRGIPVMWFPEVAAKDDLPPVNTCPVRLLCLHAASGR